MTRTETSSPSPVERTSNPGTQGEAAVSASTPARRALRMQRRAEQRARRGMLAAIVVCTVVPTVVLLALWRNLTEPFWFNEQWRAYYISDSGNWWRAIKYDGGPFPAGWFFLERFAGALFGSTELVLRLPTAVFLPVGCVLLMLLARRWMPTPAAVIVAVVGSLTGTLVSFAIQLAEYQLDATAVVVIVLLHEMLRAADPEKWGWWRVGLAYGGIALACIFSTPAVFIAGPLLLLDAVRALRRRQWSLLVGPVGAGFVILLQLQIFVVHQSALRSSAYWDAQFIPHHGIGTQATFIWDGLRGFVDGIFTATAVPGSGLLLGPQWSWLLTLVFGLLLCVGAVEAALSTRGRPLLFAMVASQVLTLIASYTRYWPFGFVRTNYYLIPLLMLLAGIGGVRIVRFSLALLRRTASDSADGRLRGPMRLATAALCAFVALGVALAVLNEVGDYRQTRLSISVPAYGVQIGIAVDTVQDEARSNAAVVVTGGVMTNPGWRYYGYEYAGKAMKTGRQIPVSRVAFPVNHGSPAINTFVSRLNPSQVFLYIPFGTTASELGHDVQAIAKGEGCIEARSKSFGVSGELVVFSCRPT